MREVAFIKKNKDKWIAFENAITNNIKYPTEKLVDLYLKLLNDLSFAQTFYSSSKTVTYLNFLASRAFQQIYKTKRDERIKIKEFFMSEVPCLMYTYRKLTYFSIVLFLIFVFTGVLSALYDEDFIRMILGDEYVDMTLTNIEAGDPVAVYKSGEGLGSFLGITFNNIYVGIRCYLYGIFMGVGTVYIMFKNAVMVGSFQTMFYMQDVLWESVKGIWIHGAMEIFSITIESTAGFILASSLLFPGSYPRLTSFRRGINHSLKIMMSTVPFTIAAGFLEGFVTRYSNSMPTMIALLIIVGTLIFIVWYYIIYPHRMFRRNNLLH